MTDASSYSFDNMFKEIERFVRLQREYKEQTLADIITKYDFDEVIEVAMRKMICNIPTMSQKEKREAVEWLTSRGYTTRI